VEVRNWQSAANAGIGGVFEGPVRSPPRGREQHRGGEDNRAFTVTVAMDWRSVPQTRSPRCSEFEERSYVNAFIAALRALTARASVQVAS
jgi:hypothetical protein